jgi:hypothetical protein
MRLSKWWAEHGIPAVFGTLRRAARYEIAAAAGLNRQTLDKLLPSPASASDPIPRHPGDNERAAAATRTRAET